MSRWLKCMSLVATGLSAVASAGLTSRALAQDGAMTELYGYGVHRFYAGDYVEAQRVLNLVIEAGIEDPRPHFFRGLTQYQLGMLDAGKADFEHAADLEAHGRRAVSVDFALQRIQGPARQEIEMARMMARVAVYQEMAAKGQLPADQQRTAPAVPTPPADGTMLPPSIVPEPGGVVAPPPTVPAQPPVVPDAQINPFQDDQVPAPAPVPAVPPTDSTNPFDSSAAPAAPIVPADPAAPGAPADPFNTPPAAEPAPTTPAPETPAAPADPFGAEPAPASPAPAEAAPAEAAPAEPTPAEPATSESAPDQPATPPAAETANPFGN